MPVSVSNSTICFVLFVLASLISPSYEYTLKLVHMDSPASPYYNANDTLELRDKRWVELSRRRFKHHLQDLGNGEPPYRAALESDPSGLLLAEFGLGKPSTRQLLIIDTGSSFMWVACEKSDYMPCNYSCVNSSDCRRVYCMLDEVCKLVPNGNSGCEWDDYCRFFVKYKTDGFFAGGSVVTDTATFGGDAEGNGGVDYDGLLFGCADVARKHPFGMKFMGTGVMGLMNSRGSVASQFQSQFSYCIGDLRDSNHSFNTLALGYDAVLEGMWTPILNYSSKVYVRLQKILVAGEALDIDPIVFEGSIYGGGTVLDSGAPLSYLTDEAYRKLRAKVNESIADDTAGKGDLSTLCRDDLEEYEVPFVRFVFDRGAELFLGFSSLFHRASPRKHCMSIRSSSSVGLDEKLSLIGLYAQQLHNVGYDYNNGRVYFWESGCVVR